ncbi:MAG: cell division protein FtsW [Anaerolineae bacterium]|nr:cell division protein FtsW [Anaerolineae bacterium]
MGAQSVMQVKPDGGSVVARVHGKTHRPAHLGFDVTFLLVVIALILFGMLMVYSASADYSFQVYGSPAYIFMRQLRWLGLGSLVMIFLALMDYHYWKKLALPLMGLAIFALVAVLIVQDTRLGSVRSLFRGSIQPSELAKFGIVIYLSVWLHNRRDLLKNMYLATIPLAVIMGFVGRLIALQPDLSAVITIGLLGTLMFFLAGGSLKHFLFMMAIGVLVGVFVMKSGLFPTGPDRMNSFIAGLKDPLQYSEHVRRSLEAFMRGGWLGVGIGKSQTKLNGLPFPHTDSVFAVVGEETGVLGAAILVILYVVFMWRGWSISRKAPDGLGMLLAGGLSFWIALEALVNMLVMVGLLPFAGNALPFVSSGGSNLIVVMASIGIILNVSRLSDKSRRNEEKGFNAVVNLRRGDRRRRVSRPVSPQAADEHAA